MSRKKRTGVPERESLLLPILDAIDERKGSATRGEIGDIVTRDIDDAVLEQKYERSGQGIVLNHIGFVIWWLKKMGLVNNSERNVLTLTSEGREALQKRDEQSLRAEFRAAMKAYRKEYSDRKKKQGSEVTDGKRDDEPLEPDEQTWENQLRAQLVALKHDAFEKLCLTILRESGYESVEGTPASRDDRINSVGILSMGLISFKVIIKCKHFTGTSVTEKSISGFVGALDKHEADRGLFITASEFTKEAKETAERSRFKIELIDGDKLCQIMKDCGLGVKKEERILTDENFFSNLT